MLNALDRLLLRVPSLDAAVHYYRDTLGLKVIRQDKTLASLALADGAGELVLHTDPDLPAEAVYFRVDDVRAMYANREKLKLTFITMPAPIVRGFRATVKDPFGTVLLLLDRSMETGSAAIEDAKAPEALFAGVEPRQTAKREVLIRIYEEIGRTADDLPYTPHFETLYSSYVSHFGGAKLTREEVWRHLLNVRKGGKLPKLGEARSTPPPVSPEAREALRQTLGEDIGRRDRLPYTARFDTIVDDFNKTQPRPLSPHLVWRLVATLAK